MTHVISIWPLPVEAESVSSKWEHFSDPSLTELQTHMHSAQHITWYISKDILRHWAATSICYFIVHYQQLTVRDTGWYDDWIAKDMERSGQGLI